MRGWQGLDRTPWLLGLALLLMACGSAAGSEARPPQPPNAGGSPAVRGAAGPGVQGAPAGAAASAAAPPLIPFVVGLSSISATNANVQATKDAGIFLKHGLDAE